MVKTKEKLAEAEQATQATLEAAQEGQDFYEEVSKSLIGYVKWPALSNTGFGMIPELLRGQINQRTQELRDLKTFWASTHEGKDLQPHALEFAIIILVSPSTIVKDCLTFDPHGLKPVKFNETWAGLTEKNCTPEQRNSLPVLANGGHRLDLLRTFQYPIKLRIYHEIEKALAKIDATNKGTRSRQELEWEREQLRQELLKVTWVAKLLDKGAIDS